MYLVLAMCLSFACGCGEGGENQSTGIKKLGEMDLNYADQFSCDYYEDGYKHIHVADGTDYVLVPEDREENDLGIDGAVFIHMPIRDIYLAASSAMDLFLQLNMQNVLAS